MMYRIITPTDFGMTMVGESYITKYLFSPAPEIEPELRSILDEIFQDLQYIDSDDRSMLSVYLNQIAEPLATLNEIGVQLVAINTTKNYKVLDKIEPLRTTFYLIAPLPCYFMLKDGQDEVVHKLGAPCKRGSQILTSSKEGMVFRIIPSRLLLYQDHSGYVPWCKVCEEYDANSPQESPLLLKKKPKLQVLKTGINHDVKLVRSQISEGENQQQEFKETLRRNVRTGNNDPEITHSCLKTIAAFLNTGGGRLYIGIADDRSITGIEVDGFTSDDRFSLHLHTSIKDNIDTVAIPNLESKIIPLDGKKICVVRCHSSNSPVFLKKGEEFYIRNGPQSVKLNAKQAVDYINNHFKP